MSNYLFTEITEKLLYDVSQQINTIKQLLVILGNNMSTIEN
jgi:hypothetical protein